MKTLPWFGAVCVLALAISCNKAPSSPSSPTSVLPGDESAAADGSTLKVSAPEPLSPVDDFRLDNRRPTMVVSNSTGKYVNHAFSYEFQLMNDSGNVMRTVTVSSGAGTTSWPFAEDLERDTPYRWRARAVLDSAVGPWSSSSRGRFFTVKEKRTPDPPPGQRLPLPDHSHIVHQVIDQNPGILSLRRSCQEDQFGGDHRGGWEFMDKVIDALRLEDTRWGYNWKRRVVGDPSLDAINYNRSAGSDEGQTDVWTVDILLGHCGPSPTPAWINITNDFGPGAMWTSRARW